VAWLDAQGKVHLFVVATGLGGWAASRILHVKQADSATARVNFDSPRLLPLSWLWNLSFLVRGAPLPLADGGMMLPVYFELGIKYPVALRFDSQGGFQGLTRMSRRKDILQPSIVALNGAHWLAFMRDNRLDGTVAVAQTRNAGLDWRDLRDLNLPNPDASIFALAVAPGHFVLAHNSSPKSRQTLDLSESENGTDWERVQTLATGSKPGAEYSYPAMVVADGSLWVSYTDGRERIAWQRFGWVVGP
jgi:predicted neuraminidase